MARQFPFLCSDKIAADCLKASSWSVEGAIEVFYSSGLAATAGGGVSTAKLEALYNQYKGEAGFHLCMQLVRLALYVHTLIHTRVYTHKGEAGFYMCMQRSQYALLHTRVRLGEPTGPTRMAAWGRTFLNASFHTWVAQGRVATSQASLLGLLKTGALPHKLVYGRGLRRGVCYASCQAP